MSYERLIREHDGIRFRVKDFESLIAQTATPASLLVASLSDLSAILEDHAQFELDIVCPQLLSSGNEEAARNGEWFRDEVETLRDTRRTFLQDWPMECIEVDRDEFFHSFQLFATQVQVQADHEEKGIYPFALSRGMLMLREH